MNSAILIAVLAVYAICYGIFCRLSEIRDILRKIEKKEGNTNG